MKTYQRSREGYYNDKWVNSLSDYKCYAPSTGVPKYINQILRDIEGEITDLQ